MKIYKPQLRAEVKKLYVDDAMTAYDISKLYEGHPSTQTILNWAVKFGWNQDRQELEVKEYERLTPQNMQKKIYARIGQILNKDLSEFSNADADAIIKFVKTAEKLLDKDFHIPMMFEVLTNYGEFLKMNYTEFVEGRQLLNFEEFLNTIRDFKNEVIAKAERPS